MKIKNKKTPPTSLSFRFPPQLRGTKGGVGFTLVELLVVITIIAILATLSFVSFQGFTRDARDATRLGQIDQIQKGLESYAIDNAVYPETNNPISITASGTIISYQGTFSEQQSKNINMSPLPLDPLDKQEYTYLTTASKDKYQLLAFMEGKEYKQTAFINNPSLTLPLSLMEGNRAYAADYTSRYPKVGGNNLGILIDAITNQPITTSVDVVTYTGSNLKAIIDNKNTPITGTGLVLYQLQNTIQTDGSKFPDKNCDKYDIQIGDQIWAGCNSTLGTTSIGTYTGACYNYAGLSGGTVCQTGPEKKEIDYAMTLSNSGSIIGSVQDNIWGKLYKWSEISGNCKGGNFTGSINNQNCPCPTNRHVPTDNEFEVLQTTLNGGINCRNATDGWLCSGLGWSGNATKTVSNNIIKALKFPLVGYRDSGAFFNRGSSTHFWLSSQYDSSNANGLYFYRNNSTVYRNHRGKSTGGFSVRCIKD